MIPTLTAHEDENGFLTAWCDNCMRYHYHGRGYGHHVAHCIKPKGEYVNGYWLVKP